MNSTVPTLNEPRFKEDGELARAVATFRETPDGALRTSFDSENLSVADLVVVIRSMRRLSDDLYGKLVGQFGSHEAYDMVHGEVSRAA